MGVVQVREHLWLGRAVRVLRSQRRLSQEELGYEADPPPQLHRGNRARGDQPFVQDLAACVQGAEGALGRADV